MLISTLSFNFVVGLSFSWVLLKIAASLYVDGSSLAASGDIRLQVCASQQLHVIWPVILRFSLPAASQNSDGPNTGTSRQSQADGDRGCLTPAGRGE